MADPYSVAYEQAMLPLAEPMRQSSTSMLIDPFGGFKTSAERNKYDSDVDISIEGDASPVVNPETGAVSIPQENGDVVIQFPGMFKERDADADEHNANLAEEIEDSELYRLAEDLLQGIEQDNADRDGWLSTTEKGIDLLGMKVEGPKSGTGDTTAPVEGMSSVRNPLLLEATLRFQANARGELLPADGPVKIKNAGEQSILNDKQAEALERDFNTYLTSVDKSYYPDTDKLLFSVGFRGCGFKKLYHDPLERRPVSKSVDAKDLIVPSTATDLSSALRVTHQVQMNQDVMRTMQINGVYLDIDLPKPVMAKVDPVTAKQKSSQGIATVSSREEDKPFTLYECYCKLNIKGFEDTDEDGEETGIPLPYRVTIDADSRKILEIRRNWKRDDKAKKQRRVFVKYPFVPAFGFYDTGLLNILGNASMALTAAWRLALDNGTFANFPGFVYSKDGVGRQLSNELRIPPGGGMGLDTGQKDVRAAVMPLPYKDLGPTFTAFMENVQATMQRVGGTAEMNVGEGTQNAPVGSTIALIEQATKVMDAVHKRLHQAQAEEFQILKELFQEDPEALHRHNDRPYFPKDYELLEQALNNIELIPQADPNVPSSMHRHMRVAALAQLASSPNFGPKFNQDTVLSVILRDMKWNPDELLIPPGQQAQQGPDPRIVAAAQKAQAIQSKTMLDQAKLQQAGQKMAFDAEQAEKDRQSKEDLAILQLANTQVIHPYSAGIASNPAIPRQIQRPR